MLSNLLENAIKFTPQGGTVTVGAAARADGAGFFVSDTGPGIEPEQLARIFDRFWRAERRGGEGLGLGLALPRSSIRSSAVGLAPRLTAHPPIPAGTEGADR